MDRGSVEQFLLRQLAKRTEPRVLRVAARLTQDKATLSADECADLLAAVQPVPPADERPVRRLYTQAKLATSCVVAGTGRACLLHGRGRERVARSVLPINFLTRCCCRPPPLMHCRRDHLLCRVQGRGAGQATLCRNRRIPRPSRRLEQQDRRPRGCSGKNLRAESMGLDRGVVRA